MSLWKLADKQANNIKRLRSAKAKSAQIVILCETLKRALKGK